MKRPRFPGTPRGRAAGAVARVLGGGGFLSEHLAARSPAASQATAEDARDSAFAREIAFGAVRHHFTIQGLLTRLARYDPQRTPDPLRAVLHTAVFQLVWMSGVPLFAAVDEAATLARQLGGGAAAGMANAVLRRVADAIAERESSWRSDATDQVRTGWQRACVFAGSLRRATDRTDLHWPAFLTGERPQRLRILSERFGEAAAVDAAWASQALPALVLHRNPLRVTSAEFAGQVTAACGPAAQVQGDTAFLDAGARGLSELLGAGAAYVQDTTAHAAARAVAAQAGELVLDLCAAPGGKSITMALGGAAVVAADVDAARLARVRENCARLGLTKVTPLLLEDGREGERLREWLAERGRDAFDAVLLDVPCSNTGVIARRPEARLGLTRGKLEALNALQLRLLRAAAGVMRPGGRLVYSTCSIEAEENDSLLDHFTAAEPAWQAQRDHGLTLPQWGPQPADWRDGGYVSVLRR